MKTKRILAAVLTMAMAAGVASGCSGGKNKAEDGKINITISDWPDTTNPTMQQRYADYVEQFKEKRPDVNIIQDTTVYADAKTFQMKAAANQLPTMYQTHYTEIQQTIDSGYASDITEVLQERGLYDKMNPQLLELSRGKDKEVYALPTEAYMQGLTINKSLFKEAGLINPDGTVMIPDTYEQLAEYAKTIKEKTGKAGFAICTTNNCGGWQFMNIAWSYGVEFMKQKDDGKWEATFNTPECAEALQYIKDL